MMQGTFAMQSKQTFHVGGVEITPFEFEEVADL